MCFTSTTSYPVRAITLVVFLREEWKLVTLDVTFILDDVPTSYNAILGWSTVNTHRMIHSTYHQLLKFLTPYRIGIQLGARSCYV